jgi:glucosamine-6-phosphate deaminase
MKTYQKDRLTIKAYDKRTEMGASAAADVADAIHRLLAEKAEIRMIFAAAPSQNEFLLALTEDKTIDFSRIVAFHMDDYIGLPADAPQGFGNFLRERLFGRVGFRKVHYIDGLAPGADAECKRYAALLGEAEIDIVCMGIGENAHIAFNDPGVADFSDPTLVKAVDLDMVCRQQQVNDGCFARLEAVPLRAITLTIPALTSAGAIFCMVPAATKADAVYNSLHGEITERYPASVLRLREKAVLYVDRESGKRLCEIPTLEQVSL